MSSLLENDTFIIFAKVEFRLNVLISISYMCDSYVIVNYVSAWLSLSQNIIS